MYTVSTPALNKARTRFSHYMRPNIVQYCEMYKRGQHHMRMVRYVIALNRCGKWEVGVMRLGHKMDEISTSYHRAIESYETLFFAKEKLEELCTISEQDGYDLSDEYESEIETLFDKPYRLNIPSCEKGIVFFDQQFNRPNEWLCQSISGGLHVLIKINHFGDIAIHDFKEGNSGIDNNNLITPTLKSDLKRFMTLKGFRGALMEGYFDGKQLNVVDAGYLHDKDLFNTPFDERCLAIARIFTTVGKMPTCKFILPTINQPRDWVSTYHAGLKRAALVKHRKSAFCAVRENRQSMKSKSLHTFLLTEQDIEHFMSNRIHGGILSGVCFDQTKRQFTVPYPASTSRMVANQYHMIGYHEDSGLGMPLIF